MSGHSKWANIKHKKGKTDALKAKLATKIGREITVAARMGGADPTGNMRLKLALQKARENNIPKDNIQRAIDKGIGATDMNAYEEIVYEGYGPAGTAFIVEAVTDNKNRTASEMRMTFSRKDGNLGADGAVSWMFKKKGIITVKSEGIDTDEFMMAALEAGAEDVEENDGVFEVTTEYTEFQTVLENLKNAGYQYEEAEITMIPENTVEITDLETAKKVMALYDALEDLDDSQNVYSNFDISDEILEQLD